MIGSSIGAGIGKVFANRRLVIVFYFANLLAGLLVAIPLRFAVAGVAGNTLMAARGGPRTGALSIGDKVSLQSCLLRPGKGRFRRRVIGGSGSNSDRSQSSSASRFTAGARV